MSSGPILSVVFFRTEAGREPVREWVKSLDKSDRKIIGEDLKLVQFSLAFGNAAGKENGSRLMGSSESHEWRARRSRSLHCKRGSHGAAPWLHQEVSRDSGGRLATRSAAKESLA
jgi:hypothetical protein